MFFVAWLRLLSSAALLLAPVATHALEDSLFTSSISYCAPPESLLVSVFDISYHPANRSVSFNVSAASVAAVNVSAHLMVDVYGIHPLNLTIDLCSVLSGALCPLPAYNFQGADSITLPSSVPTDKLPGIAYKIPDLEAFAQLILTDAKTGKVKACIQATLSNGWSTRQSAVEWSTGGLALLAFISAFWQSAQPGSMASVRLLDLFYLFQTIAASGLYAVNFPLVYRAFTLNFAWSLGLFRSSHIQHSINNMRTHTGGTVVASASNTVGLLNRKLSPYNIIGQAAFAAPRALLAQTRRLPVMNLATPGNVIESAAQLSSAGAVQTVTSQSANVLDAGVDIYVNSLQIPDANAFMTVFLVSFIFIAIAAAVLGVTYGIILFALRKRSQPGRLNELKTRYLDFAGAWGVRMALVAFLPVTLFAFFQWTLKDSWLSVLLSVFLILLVMFAIFAPSFLVVRFVRRLSPDELASCQGVLNVSTPLYAPYRAERWFTSAPILIAVFIKSLLIALGKSHGETQVIITLVVEVVLFITLVILKPSRTRRGDILTCYLALTRVLLAGLMLAFVENLAVKPIPRVAIGAVLALLLSVAVIVMFCDIVRNLGLINVFRRKSHRLSSLDEPADASMLEKATSSDTSLDTRRHHDRGRS